MRIGIDMMGGDYAPGSTLGGSLLARKVLPADVEIVLIGNQEILNRYAEQHNLDLSGFSVVNTSLMVAMDDHPLRAFKEKPRASIV